jgi:hypothetical protein
MKQALLPMSSFVKAPGPKLIKKHNRLLNKVEKPRGGKMRQSAKMRMERLAEEEKQRVGSQGWLDFMNANGILEGKPKHTDQWFQAYGPAPPLDSDSDSIG